MNGRLACPFHCACSHFGSWAPIHEILSWCLFPNNRRPLVRAPHYLDIEIMTLLGPGQGTRRLIDCAAGRAWPFSGVEARLSPKETFNRSRNPKLPAPSIGAPGLARSTTCATRGPSLRETETVVIPAARRVAASNIQLDTGQRDPSALSSKGLTALEQVRGDEVAVLNTFIR
jgi:hypothetical protein